MSETNGVYEPWHDPILMNKLRRDFQQIVHNEMSISRTEIRNLLFDDRRDIEQECGHPAYGSLIDVWQLRMLYDRLPEAAKLVELYPKWAWSVAPSVEEDADPKTTTDFEHAVLDWVSSVQPEESFLLTTEESGDLWTEMRRLDIASRIGGFGVMLWGYDDGQPLHMPVLEALDTPMSDEERKILETPELMPMTFPSMFGGTEALSGPGGIGPSVQISMQQNAKANAIMEMRRNPLSTNRVAGISEREIFDEWIREAELVKNENSMKAKQPESKPKKILWVNSFSEELVQIVRWDWNLRSPRFGLPIMYRITMNDPRGGYSGIGLPFTTLFVHWSRVTHVFDQFENYSAAKFASPPVMRSCLGELLNIRKIRGADSEGYWKAAFTKIFLETHPQLGGDVRVPEAKLQRVMENMFNSQQPWAWFAGLHANPVAPVVSDPTPHIAVNVAAMCAKMDIPKRIWEGSERGELSSGQDTGSWEGRVRSREHMHDTVKIIGPSVSRHIKLGILPQPKAPKKSGSDVKKAKSKNGFWVKWPDVSKQSDLEKAQVGQARMTSLGTYVQQGVEQIVPLEDALSKVIGFSDQDAESIAQGAEKQSEDDLFTVEPEPPPVDPSETPVQLGPETSLVHPKTGELIHKTAPPKHPPAPGGFPPQAPPKGGDGGKKPFPPTQNRRVTKKTLQDVRDEEFRASLNELRGAGLTDEEIEEAYEQYVS